MEPSTQHGLTALDWAIVIGYPLVSLAIGIYVWRMVRSVQDFIVAGHHIGLFLGVASMAGTEMGLITVMYSAQKGFSGGFATFHIALAGGLATLLVGVTGLFVYRLRALGVLTIPEFYELRFDRSTRVLGGLMMAIGGILNMGLFLKVGSMFLVGVSGLSHQSWALPAVMTFLLVLVLLYTCLGGMVSVVITDYLQFVLLAFGALLCTALAIADRGWQQLFDDVRQFMGEAGFDPTVAGGSFGWDYIVWMLFTGLASCAIWPTAVARALSMDSARTVLRQYLWSSVSFTIRFLIPYLWGIAAFSFVMHTPAWRSAFFPAGYPPPEPLPAGTEAVENLYAMPMYLSYLLPVGVLGLMTAAMLAAFMSTHDSYLLCWATVLVQDVIAPLYERRGRRLNTSTRLALSRLLIVLIGLYVWYWGLVYEGSQDIWDYMAITGSIYFAGAFALLLGGLYTSFVSPFGAKAALVAGFLAIFGLEPVQRAAGIDVPAEQIGLATIGLTLLAMVVGSFLRPGATRTDPRPWPRLSTARLVVTTLLLASTGGFMYAVSKHRAWELFWKGFLLVALLLFAAMAVVVAIGGVRDIARLFRDLQGSPAVETEPQGASNA